jgi:hypothetical protein
MKQIKEVSIYLEEGLYEKIVKLAEKDNRDFQNMVETVLKRWVEKEESIDRPIDPNNLPALFGYDYTGKYPVRSPIYRAVPGTTPVDPPNTCEGMTIGPNGAMFASTDNPNGTCVTNGEEVGDRGVEITGPWDDEDDDSFSNLHPYHQKSILNYAERVVQADGDPTKDDYGPVVRPFNAIRNHFNVHK